MQRCPSCGAITPTGSNCDVENGTCLAWTGSGTAASPHVLNLDLSAASGQILTCQSSGIQALIPTVYTRPPSVNALRNLYSSIPNNTLTTLSFTNEDYDTDTMHSSVTNPSRVTFTTAGVYIVNLFVIWEDELTGDRYVQIRKNGSNVLAKDTRPAVEIGLDIGHNVTIQESFSGGDYIEAQVQQNSGSTIIVHYTGARLSATRVA